MQKIPGGVIVPASHRVKEIYKRLDALELAVKNLTAHNISRDEICADIIESNDTCRYCKNVLRGGTEVPCIKCNGASEFIGRKLRPC